MIFSITYVCSKILKCIFNLFVCVKIAILILRSQNHSPICPGYSLELQFPESCFLAFGPLQAWQLLLGLLPHF